MRTFSFIILATLCIPFITMGQQREWKEVFRETFSPNEMEWPISQTDQRITQIKNGRFIFSHISDGRAAILARDVPTLIPEEYAIETEIYYLKGDGSGYGLVFNYSDPSNWHAINISNNGYFRYGYYLDGEYYEPIAWQKTEINPVGFSNRIRVSFYNNQMHISINGTVLNTFGIPRELGTKMGFVIYGKQTIEVNRLSILELTDVVIAEEKPAAEEEVVEEEKPETLEVPLTAVSAYESKVALIIGNSDYAESPLRNPKNDAQAMSDELKEVGFEVTTLINADRAEFRKAILDFSKTLNQNPGVALFYYAGHGIQSDGINYLVPIGAQIEASFEIEDECIRADRVLRMLNGIDNPMNIIILDACRNNPYAASFRSAERGLATPSFAPTGSIIAFATAPGKTASDGDGNNGLYTQEFIKALQVPGLSIEQVFKTVRINVSEMSDGRQIPWENSSLMGDFYFRKND